MSRRPCIPPFRPSHGHEDHVKHSATADCAFYTVGVGYTLGIYTDEQVFCLLQVLTLRQQVTGYSNGKWKKSATYSKAVDTWNLMCTQYHRHEDDSPASSVTESPPPSPTLPSSPVGAFRHSSLPPTPVAKTPSRTSAAARIPPLDRRPPIRSPSLSPSKSAHIAAVAGPSTSTAPVMQVMGSMRNPGAWRVGDSLWGLEGELLLFEDRYDAVDHIYTHHLSPAHVMETRNRRRLEAFVERRAYVRQRGDPDD
ncbi:hypothetical protein B0H14DRAFT_3696538 [Mycena olivaceomarginata]|nr:hypothetical protein B0H14DRAFT_3696538 [Mycena olivaceomarginata]